MTLTVSPSSRLPDSLSAGLARYTATVARLAGERLVSVVIFGTVLTPDWRAPRPIHHAIVTTTDDLPLVIELGRGLRSEARKLGLAAPLLLTPELIRTSLDTFPLEWLEIGTCHEVLTGSDPFMGLTCEREPIRLQCEREGTTLAMTLRQRVLRLGGLRVPLDDLAEQAVRVARGLIYLHGGAPECAPSAVIASATRLVAKDLQPIMRAWQGETGDEVARLLHGALVDLGKSSDRA